MKNIFDDDYENTDIGGDIEIIESEYNEFNDNAMNYLTSVENKNEVCLKVIIVYNFRKKERFFFLKNLDLQLKNHHKECPLTNYGKLFQAINE